MTLDDPVFRLDGSAGASRAETAATPEPPITPGSINSPGPMAKVPKTSPEARPGNPGEKLIHVNYLKVNTNILTSVFGAVLGVMT